MQELDRDRPLYENLVPVRLVFPDREERLQVLTVRIVHGYKVRSTLCYVFYYDTD
jgi:hypothetical protein